MGGVGSGGARVRSGPRPDPLSLRAPGRQAALRALPAEGYRGEAPEWPLGEAADRELIVWEEAWRSPQAAAWAEQPWRWRTIATWARWTARMEEPDATSGAATTAMRLADQIGWTPAGMRDNGWKVGEAAVEGQARPAAPRSPAKSRLKIVDPVNASA